MVEEVLAQNPRNKERKEQTLELAGMLKEKRKGTLKQLHKLIHKFCLQEGIVYDTATEYLKSFKAVGLLTIRKGSKTWKYNVDAEWELFKIEI